MSKKMQVRLEKGRSIPSSPDSDFSMSLNMRGELRWDSYKDRVLEYPKPVDDSPRKEGRVETMEFLYDDIYEEGLVERVDAANEAAIAHHANRDAEKEKEISGVVK